MATAREGLSLVLPDGTFSYVNPAFAELFGYDPEELLGEHWRVLYHEQEAERLSNDILPAVTEHGYWSGETVRQTKDGRRLVTDHRLAHTGEDVIICTASDLTDERIDRSEPNGFELLFDALEDYAFYTLDHEGYVTRWNNGAERLNGYSAAEAIGQHLSIFFTEEAQRGGRPTRPTGEGVTEEFDHLSENHQDVEHLFSSELNTCDLEAWAAFKSPSYGEIPLVSVGNTLDDIQPKPSSTPFSRIPSVEHLVPFTWRNPWTVIFNEQSGSISKLANRHRYVVTAVFDSISEQILE
jgi:PAS domain S-box-containing protein